MTLDEAIKHCEDIVECCEWEAGRCDETDRYECHEMHELGKCVVVYRQLAEWLKELKQLKEADVQPVKRGRWITKFDGDIYEYCECSECGNTGSCETPYCAQCGADMRGDTNG